MKERVTECAMNDETAKVYAITDYDVLTTMAQLDDYKVDTNNASGKTVLEIGEDFKADILKFSVYKQIVHDTKPVESNGNIGAVYISELPQGECLFLDGNFDYKYSADKNGKIIHVQTDQNQTDFKIAKVALYKYMGSAFGRTTLVLSDEDYERCFANKEQYEIRNFFGVKLDNPLETKCLYDELNSFVPRANRDDCYLEYHQVLYNIYGAYIFIGMFLGILFLLAAGSNIFYKQMMEARDDIDRYDILRKIGMSYHEARNSIRKQVGIVFLLPFSVALCHAVVTLKMFENMVYTITTDIAVLAQTLGIVVIFIIIYLVFYGLSVKGYMKTIWR